MSKAKTMAEYMEWWKNMPADERAKMKHEVTGYFVASEGSEKYAKMLDALELVEAEETLTNFIVDNMTAPGDSNMPQEQEFKPEKALEIYKKWEAANKGSWNYIFAGVDESAFLKMVETCDFSDIKGKCKNIKALQYTLVKIATAIYGRNARTLKEEFLERCNKKLKINDKVENWHKRINFCEYGIVFG